MALNYKNQDPPILESADGKVLAEWLGRELRELSVALERRLDLDTVKELDSKPQDGMLRYIENGPEGPGFYGYITGVWVKFGISGDVLIGYYDQVADLVSGGPYDGLPLPLATDFGLQDREYMILNANGAFTTTNPNLAGLTGSIGNVIRVFDGAWEQEDIGSAYLSAIIDDTADGHITLTKTPTAPQHAAQLQQVSAVESSLNTHVAQTTISNDVHGSKTYTDTQDSAHAALVADPDDPHQTKTYTDQEITALATASIDAFVATAYGGLVQDTSPVGPNLGIGWDTVPFSSGAVSVSRDVVQNVANNSLTFNEEGVYYIGISLSFLHDESQQGRETNLRYYNLTDGVVLGNPIPIGIARNQPSTVFSWGILLDVPASILNKEVVIQLGGGDSVNINEWSASEWNTFHVSEYKGTLT